MLVAICSDKGSPGVTTTALVLASAWPSPAVVVEADQAGGDLAIRLRHGRGTPFPEAPTVLTVATAARVSRTPDLVGRYAHEFTKSVSVVPGTVFAEQVGGIGDWAPLADALACSEVPVFVDLGRLHSGSRLMSVAARADVVVLVGRPDPGSVIRMRERLSRLAPDLGAMRGTPPRLFPILVTPNRHGQGDVADLRAILDTTPAKPFVVGSAFLAMDPVAVRRLELGEEPTGRLARTTLMRSGRAAAEILTRVVDGSHRARTSGAVTGGAP